MAKAPITKKSDKEIVAGFLEAKKNYASKAEKEAILRALNDPISELNRVKKQVTQLESELKQVKAEARKPDTSKLILDWISKQAQHGKLRRWDYNLNAMLNEINRLLEKSGLK